MSYFEQSIFQLKSEGELQKQVLDAEEGLEEKSTQPSEQSLTSNQITKEELIPPFFKGNIFEMSGNEIKQQFPRRYGIYLDLLRARKSEKIIASDELEKMRSWLHTLNSIDLYIELHTTDEENRTLREQQFIVFEKLKSFLEGGGSEGYIKLPTGFGKTVIFSEFLEAIDQKSLVLVPTQPLVTQTKTKLAQFAETMSVGQVYAYAKEYDKQVTIMTYDSLIAGLKNNTINPSQYRCVILDEAHHALGQETSRALEAFPDILQIGFTATPDYTENKKLSHILEHEIHSVSPKEAIEMGALAPTSVIFAHTEVDLSSVPIDKTGEFSKAQLEKAVNVASRNQGAVDLYRQMFFGQSAVVYCSGIAHATALAELFNKNGISAAMIKGEDAKGMKKNEELLQQFASGEILVLCNANLLVEGFDETRASVCLNLRPTLSRVMAEQRGGRVLRIDEHNPDKHSYIVDFLDKNTPPDTVTFADILESAYVEHSTSPKIGTKETMEPIIRQPMQVPRIEGLRVIVNSDEVMRIVREIKNTKELIIPQKKSGWKSAKSLTKETGKTDTAIRSFADQFRESHLDWFEIQQNYSKVAEHYHPDLVQKIVEHFSAILAKKDGWENAKSLMKELNIGYTTIISFIEQFRKGHPDWFEMQQGGLRTVEHYHPNLAHRAIEHFSTIPLKKDGWESANFLRYGVGKKPETIKTFAEQFRIKHPEWFEMQRTIVGQKIEHYHPDLVRKISEHFSAIPVKKDGWENARSLRGITKKKGHIITVFVEQFRSTHPDWFEMQKSGTRSSEHYHPDLIIKIIEHFNSTKKSIKPIIQ